MAGGDVYSFPNWMTLQNLSNAPIHPTPPMANLQPTPGPSNFGGVQQVAPSSRTFVKNMDVGPQGPRAIFHKAALPRL